MEENGEQGAIRITPLLLLLWNKSKEECLLFPLSLLFSPYKQTLTNKRRRREDNLLFFSSHLQASWLKEVQEIQNRISVISAFQVLSSICRVSHPQIACQTHSCFAIPLWRNAVSTHNFPHLRVTHKFILTSLSHLKRRAKSQKQQLSLRRMWWSKMLLLHFPLLKNSLCPPRISSSL